jgi:hypothetical protein
MRPTLRICTLPLLAGLLCSLAACNDSTTKAKLGQGGEGGEEPTGSGGTTIAEAGSTAAGGATATTTTTGYTKCWDFNDSVETWKKNYASEFKLDDKAARDEAAATKLLGDTTADWTTTYTPPGSTTPMNGYGNTPGFVLLTIPYLTTQVEFQGLLYSNLPAPPLQLAGKTIHAFVKLVSGMTVNDPSHPSGAKIVVKSGTDWFYGDGGWVNLSKNDWTELLMDVSNPANVDGSKDRSLYDANDIREVSVEFDTSGSATTIETPGVLMLDHVCY